MRVRRIKALCQLAKEQRYEAIAEGLSHIVENVQTLASSLRALESRHNIRGYRILRGVAEEEAAKFLILLDYVRCPSSQSDKQSRMLGYFYDHSVKCLYVDYCAMRPATWAQVCEWVENMRPERYLDGQEGVHWISRNELLQQREQGMYVDYVEIGGEYQWASPRELDDIGGPCLRSHVMDTVSAMRDCGFHTSEALHEISAEWKSLDLEPATCWHTIEDKNRHTLERLESRGILPSVSKTSINQVIGRWYFPLCSLELRLKDVATEDLEQQREEG